MRGRAIVMVLGAQAVASFGLLIWASTTPPPLPRWGGAIDVGLALTLAATVFLLQSRVGGLGEPADIWRAHATLTTFPSVVLVAIWIGRAHLDFNILLPGLAWRLFLLLYAVPAILAAWRGPR